jgi:hypothetical protein
MLERCLTYKWMECALMIAISCSRMFLLLSLSFLSLQPAHGQSKLRSVTNAQTNAGWVLPGELATRLQEITASCKEDGIQISAEREPGVRRIDLNGDGSQDVLFDSQQVCGSSPGHGCSNRGCYLVVYKQMGLNSYRKVLDELYDLERFISISKSGRLNLIAYSSPGEFGRCRQKSRSEDCDYLLFWRRGQWAWETIQ